MGRKKLETKKDTLSAKIPLELKEWFVRHCKETEQSGGEIITALLEFYRGLE